MITVFILLTISGASPEDVAKAKLFFESGKRAYDQGEYDAAIAAFEQADEIAPAPALYFSMAQAFRLQFFADGRVKGLRTAARLYAKYLADAPKGRRRADAVEHIAAVETILARRADDAEDEGETKKKTQLMISASAAAEVAFRGKTTTAPLILEVEPGTHTATVTAPGYQTQIIQRVAVPGRLVVAHLELVERPAIVSLAGAQDAELRIDGQRIGTLPVTDLRLASGDHRVQVLDRGKRPYDRLVHFNRGQDVALTIDLEDTSQRKGAYWMLAAGGASAIIGGVFAALAGAAQNRAVNIQTRLENGGALSADDIRRFRDLRGDRDGYTLIAAPALIGSALSLTIGGLLYVLDTPRLDEDR